MEDNTVIQNQVRVASRKWEWLAPFLLTGILILGALFRFTGVNWDEDQHLHPDERFLTMVTTALTIPGISDALGMPPAGCAKWGGYFDSECSPLNPYNHGYGLFVYGTLPIFVTRLVGDLLDQTGYGQIHIVGRLLSALFDLSTVLIIYFIGRRLYGTRAALLGAFFLAASVLDIQQSHFFTVDTFTNIPILLAFWFALDIADGKKWTAFVFAGVAFGVALAGRINIAPFALVLIAAAAVRAYRAALAQRAAWRAAAITQVAELAPEDGLSAANAESQVAGAPEILPVAHPAPASVSLEDFLWRAGARALVGLAVAALVALFIFRIGQPYAANGPNLIAPHIPKPDLSRGVVPFAFDVALSWAGGVNLKFADNMAYIGELVAGRQDYPPGHQWTNRTAYLFPLENMVLWGLGLPLGIAAWIGFAFALYRLIRYREWQHLLILVWVGITFAYTGQQWVKTLRYFLQIYPFLALLAGYLLVALWEHAPRWTIAPALARIIAGGIALIVIGYTLFWATAFTTIYTRPVSRVTASRWIFQNVPLGSALGNEHWDDPLPLRMDGKDPFGGMYRGIASSSDGVLHWYDEDTPEKRVAALQWLDDADYLILSSGRLSGSITRLPMRYPLTTQYYRALFDGSLGFELAAEITSRPQLFGIAINDDDAEEQFTVYDHPKVLIYKKSARYSHANTAQIFNRIDLDEVYRFWPREATTAPTALLLTPADREAQMRGGTWSEIFNPADLVNQMPSVAWLALIEILGWITFPLAFVVFRALSDRGYIFAKTLGILLPAWGAWTLASYYVLPFGRASIALVIAGVALVSVFAAWRARRELRDFFRAHGLVVLIEELLFLLFFAAFLLVRYGNPDLWHQWFGGEKPMDFALLNAVIKSTWMPPYDPWFAGGYLNYYYFGQLITATLIKFSGIVPEVAYNLALPLYFALTALGAFSSVLSLARGRAEVRLFAGLLGAIFVAVMGNLGQVILIGQTLIKIGGGDPQSSVASVLASIGVGIYRVLVEQQPFDVPIGWWYWNATRIIPDTINEFPFFSFLYADLHAHVMALPFTLVVIGFCVNWVVRERNDTARLPFWPHLQISPTDVGEVLFASLAFGALRAINFADYPTYLLLIGCALAIGEYARWQKINWDAILAVAWRFGAVVVFSTALYLPFVKSFASAYLSVEMWRGERTGFAEYLVVHGIFLFVIVTFLIAKTFDTKERRTILFDWMPLFVVLLIAVEGVFIIAKAYAFALGFPLLAFAGILVLRPDCDARTRMIALMIAAGLAMTLMVEVITYKGDIGRMNTVFKFYLQVWVFFAVASAAALTMLQTQDETPNTRRTAFANGWVAMFGVLVVIGLLYPITATRAKVTDRYTFGSPAGLNGMDYMRTAIYAERGGDLVLEADRQAIEWLRANVAGSPVIVEGNTPLYRWGSRVAIYTGLPTVIGWDWHQKQQRSIVDGAIIDRRLDAVKQIYNTRSADDALAQLKRFRVTYIYVGDVERGFYEAAGLAKFDAMARAGQLQLAYQNDRVKIFKLGE